MDWISNRPELSVCTPKQLLEDIRKFLEVRRGQCIESLDLTTLPTMPLALLWDVLYNAVVAVRCAVPEVMPMDWTSNRPELSVCTPKQLLEDIRKFLEARRGKQLQSSSFPEAILNGQQLDLNAMYRAVCSRGGYAMGTGVNWAGQVYSNDGSDCHNRSLSQH